MVIDGLPSVQIYTCKGRACISGGESRAGDYIQSLSFCQREMEGHYLTVLFPPEHITLPSSLSVSLSLPLHLPTYCLSSGKQNGVGTGTQGRMRTGRRGQAYAFPHSVTLYINKWACASLVLLISDPINSAREPTAAAAALPPLAHQVLNTERKS